MLTEPVWVSTLQPVPPHLPVLVQDAVHTVLVDPAPDPRPVYLVVGEVAIKRDVAVLVFQFVGDVGIEREQDEELPGATPPGGPAGLTGGTEFCDGGFQVWRDEHVYLL